MASISPPHPSIWSSGAQKHCFTGSFGEGRRRGYIGPLLPFKSSFNLCFDLVYNNYSHKAGKHAVYSVSVSSNNPTEPEDENSKKEPPKPEGQQAGSNSFRDNLERTIGVDDSMFSGADLAALIRNKYGRSYDVQLIKKEFMGRNLLAMNVMWKYREQRSFPLTEEEYILRLDDVANNLRCWGAVSHIRNSLAKLKERPRIGKVTKPQRFLYKCIYTKGLVNIHGMNR